MHDERRVARERLVAALLFVAWVVGPLLLREVRDVVAGPLPIRLVPPHQLLPLAPRRAVGARRAAVVEDAAVERPCVTPAVTVPPLRLALVCLVLAVVHAGVDPAAARRRAVVLQRAEVLHVPLDLAEHRVGVVVRVAPRERAQPRVARRNGGTL